MLGHHSWAGGIREAITIFVVIRKENCQSEGGGTVVMFAFGRNEGRGCVEHVVVVLRRVWPSKLIGIGMYS